MAKVNNLELQFPKRFASMEKHVDRSIESVQMETRINLETVQQTNQLNMESWERKLDMFITKIGGYFMEKNNFKVVHFARTYFLNNLHFRLNGCVVCCLLFFLIGWILAN